MAVAPAKAGGPLSVYAAPLEKASSGPRLRGGDGLRERQLPTPKQLYKLTVASIHNVQRLSTSSVPKVAKTPICRPSGALPGSEGV